MDGALDVFEANGIPYSANYHFMVEDGLFPRATRRKMLEYLNGFDVPENLKETLEVLGPIKERPTRRSERLKAKAGVFVFVCVGVWVGHGKYLIQLSSHI